MFRRLLAIGLVIFLFFGCGGKKNAESADSEVTVKYYNAPLPKLSLIYQKLDYLETPDYDKAISEDVFKVEKDVYKSAFALGVLTADAILLVRSRNKTKLENLAREMIDYSKIVGIEENILSLSDNILKLIQEGKWDILEETLERYKTKVKYSLYESGDYELFTMLQFGGWVEGLNRACFFLDDNYKKSKTVIIKELGVISQLLYNMNNIKNPELKNQEYFSSSINNLDKIKAILNSSVEEKYTHEQIKQILSVTDSIKDKIRE